MCVLYTRRFGHTAIVDYSYDDNNRHTYIFRLKVCERSSRRVDPSGSGFSAEIITTTTTTFVWRSRPSKLAGSTARKTFPATPLDPARKKRVLPTEEEKLSARKTKNGTKIVSLFVELKLQNPMARHRDFPRTFKT